MDKKIIAILIYLIFTLTYSIVVLIILIQLLTFLTNNTIILLTRRGLNERAFI